VLDNIVIDSKELKADEYYWYFLSWEPRLPGTDEVGVIGG